MMQAPVITAALLVSPVLMVCLAFCLLAVLLMLILRGGERKQKCARTRRHQRYRATAARLLARLKTLPEDAHRLKYLRKINPYVFEELLLLALKQQGMTVIHNPCYSGDGGPDGQVMINGERWLIQAKRYGRTIRPAHIDAFGELLRREGCRGFFIHTGRTGSVSRARLTLWPDIELVSGQRLLKLLNGTLLTDELTRGGAGMMTVKQMFMLLFRTVIVWPSVLTGCLMMLYFVEVASGGVTGLAQRYEAESARWRDAPEGTVMMLRCPSRPFVTPVTTGEWRALSATDAECLRSPHSFRQAAEADFQSLHILALTLLLASVVLEGVSAGMSRRKTASVPVSPHCGCGRGRGAVAHWPDHDNDAIPQKGGQV